MSDTIGLLVLERDDWRCFRCGRIVLSLDHNCHHRMYAGSGGPDTPENRITLCGFGNNRRDANGREWCHGWVHHNKTEAMASGWAISRHELRPIETIPVVHWMLGAVLLDGHYGINQVREEPNDAGTAENTPGRPVPTGATGTAQDQRDQAQHDDERRDTAGDHRVV